MCYIDKKVQSARQIKINRLLKRERECKREREREGESKREKSKSKNRDETEKCLHPSPFKRKASDSEKQKKVL